MEALVFSTPKCTWCEKVVRVLKNVNVKVDKIDITESRENYDMMTNAAGDVKTVPQVVVDGKYIGGYTEIERFLRKEKLLH
tara:strand:- start:623 stop:865 length:243 start_codon:yes stop_codon:yes gene_type:complete